MNWKIDELKQYWKRNERENMMQIPRQNCHVILLQWHDSPELEWIYRHNRWGEQKKLLNYSITCLFSIRFNRNFGRLCSIPNRKKTVFLMFDMFSLYEHGWQVMWTKLLLTIRSAFIVEFEFVFLPVSRKFHAFFIPNEGNRNFILERFALTHRIRLSKSNHFNETNQMKQRINCTWSIKIAVNFTWMELWN